MGSMDGETQLVHDLKLSTVVPATVANGDADVFELTPMAMAVKLHYIKGLYFFNSDAARGVDIFYLKKFLFDLLDTYHPASGRVRRSEEDGRPFIKCNDSGVRIVEANCDKTVGEWLALAKKDHFAMNDQLVPSHVLGPDLGYSPLFYIQYTFFKCGGLSIGLSLAHILGDAFSLARFINMLGPIMEGHVRDQPLNNHYLPNTTNAQLPHSIPKKPHSIKRVEPVGDYWIAPTNDCQMKTQSYHVTDTKLDQILSSSSELSKYVKKPKYFDLIAAIVWKSVAKARGNEPRVVTLCCDISAERGNETALTNSQLIGSVEADFNVGEADVLELVKLISEGMVKESNAIEENVQRESGDADVILYGANLTFVNLEDEDIYGLRLKGKRPVFANYTVSGVGKEGLVVVVPGPGGGKEGDSGGRTVTVTMPENKITDLKNELVKEWGIY